MTLSRGPWEGLNPPYRTIVADPPWDHSDGFHGSAGAARRWQRPADLPYSVMQLGEVGALPVAALSDADAHLYLWTTNRFLRHAFGVVEQWGFTPAQTLVWCKPPLGIGPGGAFAQTTEYALFARRGRARFGQRESSTWHIWPRGRHSRKPAAFFDLVERVSPGPYVELFARQPRFGWDSWGWGYENVAEVSQ